LPIISFLFTKEMTELLKKIRIKSGLSQAEVAERMGLSSKTKVVGKKSNKSLRVPETDIAIS